MRQYESTVIFNPTLSDTQFREEAAKVETFLKSKGAKDIKITIQGRKEIAYLVRKNKFGNFVNYNFEVGLVDGASLISELNNILRITDSVIKFQSHRINLPARKFKGNPRRKTQFDSDDFGDSADSFY